MKNKQYKGSVYIAVVGNESENGQCRDSIENIQTKKGDTKPLFVRATKGYEARQMHLNNWYKNTKHPFILFLDHDMIFPKDTLERLRKHALPYVSGFYMRRTINPPVPVWFENGEVGKMPMKPLTFVPEKNMLYPIGASGWGCVLIHRDVIKRMKKILKGEDEIIEDDMDIAPYDLKKLFGSLNALRGQIALKQPHVPTMEEHIKVLLDELIPLRMVKDLVGSDIRFPFFAKLAGYQLYGDSGVDCGHVLNYPVSMNDYNNQPAHAVRSISVAMQESHNKEIKRLKKARTV